MLEAVPPPAQPSPRARLGDRSEFVYARPPTLGSFCFLQEGFSALLRWQPPRLVFANLAIHQRERNGIYRTRNVGRRGPGATRRFVFHSDIQCGSRFRDPRSSVGSQSRTDTDTLLSCDGADASGGGQTENGPPRARRVIEAGRIVHPHKRIGAQRGPSDSVPHRGVGGDSRVICPSLAPHRLLPEPDPWQATTGLPPGLSSQ